MERCRVYYKGEGGGFPQVRAVVSLVCSCCPWLVLAPKVFQLCTNHLVWVVCRPVWCVQARVNEWSLSTLPSPISKLQHAPLPLKVLWAKEHAPIPPPSVVLYLDSLLNLTRNWECVNRTQFLFHPYLYSTWSYQSPNDLILGMSIKVHLVSLGNTTLNHLNYLSLHMPFYHMKGILLTNALYLIASVDLCITKEGYIFVTSSKKFA